MNQYAFQSIYKKDFHLFLEKREKELSLRTFKNDVTAICSFDSFLSELSDQSFSGETIGAWIASIKNVTDGTINNYITPIRVFLSFYCALNNAHCFMPEYRRYPDTYIPYYFSGKEKKEIYDLVDNYKSYSNNRLPWITIEFPMVVRIIDGCGTRIAEIVSLKMQDVDFDNNVLIIKNAKSRKQRRVPMSDSLSKILLKYCYTMGIIGKYQSYLFPRRSKEECLTVADVSKRFAGILYKLGIRKKGELSLHERGPCLYNYRHTFTIDSYKKLLSNGITVDDTICYLSVYLGHHNLTETQAYLKCYLDIFPEDVDRFYETADELAPKEDKWEKWGL